MAVKIISFDPSHDADQRRQEIGLVMEGLEPFELRGMTLKKEGYPDADYNGDDAELALADEIVINYEKD